MVTNSNVGVESIFHSPSQQRSRRNRQERRSHLHLGMVEYTYNLSYSGGRGRKDCKFEDNPGKVSKTLSQKNK
jgi:hypothetical protein